MFGTFRKHQTWLWAVIIAVVSITMVVFFSNNVSLFGTQTTGKGAFGSMNGVPFNQTASYEARMETVLPCSVRTDQPPGGDEAASRRLESDTVPPLFLIHK